LRRSDAAPAGGEVATMALADAAVQTDVSISSVAACEAWAQFEAALRASTSNTAETPSAPSPEPDEERTQSNESVTHDLSAASEWKLALTELKTRLARLITGGKGKDAAAVAAAGKGKDAAAVAAAKAQVAEVLALKNVTVPDKANASKYELQAQMMYCGMDLMTAGPGASKFYEAELAHLREEHPELFQWEELRRLENDLTLEAGHMSNPSKELVAVRERIKEIDAEIRAGQWKPPLGRPLFGKI